MGDKSKWFGKYSFRCTSLQKLPQFSLLGTEIGVAKERSSSISLPCSSDRAMQLAHLSSLHIKHCCLSCSFVIVNGLAGWYMLRKPCANTPTCCGAHTPPKKKRQKQRNALFSTPGFISAFWANLNFDIQEHVAVFHGVWIYYETMVVLCCNDDSYIIPSSAAASWNSGASVFVTIKVTLKGAAIMSCQGDMSWQNYLYKV